MSLFVDSRASLSRVRAFLAIAAIAGGCRDPELATLRPSGLAGAAEANGPVVRARERIDAHVHVVDGSVDELLAALDRHGISRAVVIASPHLDPSHPPTGEDVFAGWREADERLLAQTAGHRERLLPFVTVEPAEVTIDELEGWLSRGACGVKLYVGHRDLHRRPLADPRHAPLLVALERLRVPLLLHVNTFRFEGELGALLETYPDLEMVCPHFCGSRTDIDRLERLLRRHPGLRVDTSHGPGQPGIDGFASLEREHERVRRLILAAPERFLFGSDLVAVQAAGGADATRREWDRQIAANLDLLMSARLEFWRAGRRPDSLGIGDYRGLALDDAALAPVLGGNARRWLARCLR